MLKVGLIGFGRAGKSVASVLLGSDAASLEWVVGGAQNREARSAAEYLDSDSADSSRLIGRDEVDFEEVFDNQPVDVIIDFSCAEGLDLYADVARKHAVDVVSAISDYPDSRVQQLRELGNTSRVVWSPNITVGINFIIIAAKILKQIAPHADIEIIEEHFAAKSEASGTAKVIAENLGKQHGDIKSIRAGGIVGHHEVIFGFPYQTVRLSHDSIAREAFGNGVLFALEHMLRLGNGFYSMQDLIEPFIYEQFQRGSIHATH